jgi:hypothetical protein
MDRGDLRVTLKKGCDRHCAALLTLDSRKERPYASQRLIGIERRAHNAGDFSPSREVFRVLFPRCDDCATYDVGVTVEIFGYRVDNEIGAQRDRLLKGRREESVVNGDFGSNCLRPLGDYGKYRRRA